MKVKTLELISLFFLFLFVWYWNDFYYGSMFYNTLKTMLIALDQIMYLISSSAIAQGESLRAGQRTTLVQAGSLLTVGPVVIIYLILQRYFTESIERTGIVG